MDRLAVFASALLHLLILLLILLHLPDGGEDGAGGLPVDVVFDVPGDGTQGTGDDAAAEAAPAPAETAEVTPETPPPEPPPPEQAMVEPPPPEPPSAVPDPVAAKPPPQKPRPPRPQKPKPAAVPTKPPAATTPTPASLPGNGTGAVTTGQGEGNPAGADDPNAAAGDVAGAGGPLGNGVPRVMRGKDMGDAELRNRLIGNTLSGMMGNRDGAAGRYDIRWQAYVRPDGTVIARVFYKGVGRKGTVEERSLTEKGRWTLENGLMCLKFEKEIDLGAKDCFHVQDVDKKMAFYYAGCPFNSSDRCHTDRLGQFGEVLPGNAYGF